MPSGRASRSGWRCSTSTGRKTATTFRPRRSAKLADLDPALIVTPPKGLEIGYVPIVTRQAAAKLKVFILAGQSNMEGQAVADLDGKDYNGGKGTLMHLLKDPAKAALVKHLRTDKGEWAVRD